VPAKPRGANGSVRGTRRTDPRADAGETVPFDGRVAWHYHRRRVRPDPV